MTTSSETFGLGVTDVASDALTVDRHAESQSLPGCRRLDL